MRRLFLAAAIHLAFTWHIWRARRALAARETALLAARDAQRRAESHHRTAAVWNVRLAGLSGGAS